MPDSDLRVALEELTGLLSHGGRELGKVADSLEKRPVPPRFSKPLIWAAEVHVKLALEAVKQAREELGA